jgi:hypothetical protein
MLCSKEGHPMLARMAFLKALDRDVVIAFDPGATKEKAKALRMNHSGRSFVASIR